MDRKNIKQTLGEYVQTILVDKTAYFIEGKGNKASLSDKLDKDKNESALSIKINEDEIELFRYDTKDELEELYSWNVFGCAIFKDDVIKCFVLSEDLLKKTITYEGTEEKLGYKIIIDRNEVLEQHYELFTANIQKIIDLTKREKYSSFREIYEKLFNDKKLCVFEINNLSILNSNPKLKRNIEKDPIKFLKTNLVILNNELNLELICFEFDERQEEQKELQIKEVTLSKYPFYLELISFLESAQRIKHYHLKYIDYYHVIEYFITEYAYKNLESSLKRLVSVYLEGGNYEEFKRILYKISEEENIIQLGKDQPLLEVLKPIGLQYTIKIINDFKLHSSLKKDIFRIENTRLILDKWARPNLSNINSIEVSESDEGEFFTRLYRRIYMIRNVLIHSKAKFRGNQEPEFMPTPEYEKQLVDDTILIRELALKLCRIQCVDMKE